MAPPEPSFLDMRNAILAAEAGLAGAHRNAVWQVFAARGMGYLAYTDGAGDITPTQDFSLPPAPGGPSGRTTGTVTAAESGLALANVAVGLASLSGEAAFPDQLATRTAANGTYALDAPAGTYGELAIEHPGYDRAAVPAFPVTAGGTRVQDVALRRDWAASAGGGSSCCDDRLRRQRRAVRLRARAAERPAAHQRLVGRKPAGVRRQAVVRLPQAIDVTGFGLDPGNTCGNGPEASTRRLPGRDLERRRLLHHRAGGHVRARRPRPAQRHRRRRPQRALRAAHTASPLR